MSDDGGGASHTTEPAEGSSTATDVSLREFVGMQIGYERRGTFMLVGGVLAFGAFAWSEIQRRLSNLNHENARILAAQASSVSADTYKGDEQRRKGDQDRIESRLGQLGADVAKSATKEEVKEETRTDRRAGFSYGWVWIGGVIGVILVLLALLNYASLHHVGGTVTVTVPTTTTTP